MLSKKFNTKVSVESVELSFFKTALLNKVLVLDQRKDTLLFVEKLHADISLFSFWKKDVVLNEIDIEGVNINLNRSSRDSSFNFSFLLPQKSTSLDTIQKDKWLFDLDELNMHNVHFNLIDSLKKTYLKTSIKTFELGIDKLDFSNQLKLNSILIEQPEIVFSEYNDHLNSDTLPFVLNLPFDFSADLLEINKGKFAYINSAFHLKSKHFDPNFIATKNIEIKIEEVSSIKNEIKCVIDNIQADERSGIALLKLKGDFILSNKSIGLSNLMLKTRNSEITDRIAIQFKSFADFKHFDQRVVIMANFNKTKVNTKDIAYFVDLPINLQNTEFDLTGKLKGKVNDFEFKNLLIEVDHKTKLQGDISMKGLPDFKKTWSKVHLVNLSSSITNVKKLLPSQLILPNQLTHVGNFSYVGDFEGYYNNFKTKGTLTTEVGKLFSNIEVSFDEKFKDAKYIGEVKCDDLQLGKILDNQNLLGATSFNFNLNGRGVKWEEINSKINGTVKSFVFKNYNYQNIQINGNVLSSKFDGSIVIDDPNFKSDFNGQIAYKDSIPIIKMQAKIQNIDLQKLNLYDQPWRIKTLLTMDLSGKNIDDIEGEFNVDDFEIFDYKNAVKYPVDILSINASRTGKQRVVTIYSDILNAELSGVFAFKDLPKIVNKYFLSYFNETNTASDFEKNTNINFDFSFENSKRIIQLFVPQLKNIEQANINGNFDNQSKVMNINASISGLQYMKYSLAHFKLNGQSNATRFNINSSIDSLYNGDSLIVAPIVFAGAYNNKILRWNLKASNETSLTRLNLTSELKGLNNGFDLHFLPSQIMTNGKKWTFDAQNKIVYQNKILSIQDLTLVHNDESLKLFTKLDQGNIDLYAQLKKVNLHDILAGVMKKNNIFYGKMNGYIKVKNALKNPAPIANLLIEDLVINKDTIGKLKVFSKWIEEESKVEMKGNILGKFQDINLDGYYKANKTGEDMVMLDIDINKFTPNFLDNFVSEYMYKNRGKLSGKLKFSGPISKPLLTGFMNINYLETTVNSIHTTYYLKNQIARFTEKGISLDGVTFKDRFGNLAYGGGMIYHTGLKNFYMDLFIKSSRIECLNTNYKINNDWWGNVFAEANVKFNGATDALIDIDIQGKALEGSDFTLLFGGSKETEKYNFITFRDKNSKKKNIEKTKNIYVNKAGVNIDIDVEVTRPCKLHVIFDPLAEDKINAEGRGNIKLRIKKNGEFTVLGDYKIDQGDYLFTFQNVVKRKFYLKSGGLMNFVGDPFKSTIFVDAVFRTRANPYDLLQTYIDGGNSDLTASAKSQIPIDLNLKLRNNLLKPDIDFDITFLSFDSRLKTAFDNLVSSMKNNENELNRQVFGILVFNRFMPPIYNPYPNNSLNQTDWQNTLSDWLSNQLSNYVSDWLTNFITDVNFGLKLRSYNQTDVNALNTDLRRELQLSLSKRFANNRLIVNVGGNFDFGNQNTTTNTTKNFAGGDLELEYVLSKDGNVRIRAFSKGQYDAFNTRAINRTGVGISYRQEFEDFKDLKKVMFKKK